MAQGGGTDEEVPRAEFEEDADRGALQASGTLEPSPARVERIKFLATYLNTVGAGFMVTGVIGPFASYLYGLTSPAEPWWQLVLELGSLVSLSLFMHFLARVVLGRLDR